MQTQITRQQPYAIPEIEGVLKALSEEAATFTKLTAQEWGEKKEGLTEIVRRTIYDVPLQQRVVGAIDKIRKYVGLIGLVYDVQQVEKAVNNRIASNGKLIVEKRELLEGFIRDQQNLSVNLSDIQKRKLFYFLVWCFGIADGCLAFAAFLSAGYGLFSSLVTGAVIALAIACSHLFYTPWIMTAPTRRVQYKRGAVVLGVALIFFAAFGFLRAMVLDSVPEISMQSEYVTTTYLPPFTGWIIAIVSWVLFAVVLFLALKYWRSKAQEEADYKYCELQDKINAVNSEIRALQKEQETLTANLATQKVEAVRCANYLKESFRECRNIARENLANFKRLYARYHGSVPDHFDNDQEFVFDDSLNITQQEN